MKKPDTKIIFARMEPAEAKLIQQKCRENDETVSQLLRRLLRIWMKKNNANNAK